jgi:hypothetical protein
MQKTFMKGTQTGVLRETMRETFSYRWVPCLALMAPNGVWLVSMSWPRNSFNRAVMELESLGWRKECE